MSLESSEPHIKTYELGNAKLIYEYNQSDERDICIIIKHIDKPVDKSVDKQIDYTKNPNLAKEAAAKFLGVNLDSTYKVIPCIKCGMVYEYGHNHKCSPWLAKLYLTNDKKRLMELNNINERLKE